jgi:2-iminobutanoate/2-iminopropanoate deaminase
LEEKHVNRFINEEGSDLSAYGLSSAAVAGDLVFAAAMALDGETMQRQAAAESIEDETRICLRQLEELLGLAGCELDDIVKINCYLADDSYRTEFWKTYDEIFADIDTAAVRLTQVVGIACGCRVELDAVAVLREASAKA